MIFIDTGAWFALEDANDRHHAAATTIRARISKGEYGGVVTSDHVLDETLTHLALKGGVAAAGSFLDRLRGTTSVQVLWIGEDLFWKATDLLRSRGDKEWSFTDCTSFVAMEALGIRTAFSFDRHFAQAGFEVVPDLATGSGRT